MATDQTANLYAMPQKATTHATASKNIAQHKDDAPVHTGAPKNHLNCYSQLCSEQICWSGL
jgi:hypothetical protein